MVRYKDLAENELSKKKKKSSQCPKKSSERPSEILENYCSGALLLKPGSLEEKHKEMR